MNLEEINILAKKICDEYNYPLPTKIILRKRMHYLLAECNYSERIIKLNNFVVSNNPDEVIEAILIHEIVHFKYHNHGEKFVKEVRRMNSHENINYLFPDINYPY